MKEMSSKANYRVKPVSGRDTGSVGISGSESMDTQDRLNSTMTAEEQQIAEIMSQSKEDTAENNTILRFKEGINQLMAAFNFDVMDTDQATRMYVGIKDNSNGEDGDVDSDSSSASAAKGTKRRRTRNSVGVLSQKLPPIREDENGAGPSSCVNTENQMDTLDGNMITERERAMRMRREVFGAPAKEELRARTSIPVVVKKPPQKKDGTSVKQGEKTTNKVSDDSQVQPSARTLKGRIRVHKLEAEKVMKILEEKNMPVNLKMTKDGSTIVSSEAEQRLDVVKVLRESGQSGHSYRKIGMK